ncbi:MAG: YheU family protein [Magnetococcales bacterium]|nr:YheU family protein [Magnetococcales bacterium]
MIIPADRLTPEALRAIVEAFVTSDMPEDWSTELPLAVKVAQVIRQIHAGLAEIRFDPITESCGVFMKEEK